ncbi:MAG: tRNA (adenosine(37)-N6)-threonylcarbamoyltransferase complex dimerization subunit type 1 TsaB [Chloroflexota bacterium]|nr:tRNA (adenosine(37)-N6)-threonylcarbamoyltransferase complex dimerization subunit type 1 TsaB [Chloroflexota bacterium]
MLLAIDTSTHLASLALTDDAKLLAELNWRVGQRHGSDTLERARWLLAGQGVTMAQLDGVAVALGPGSFNGVRVALATAKSLAFALDVPLYGISTLDAIAWGALLAPDPIWALLDAGRGEVYAARYLPDMEATAWAPQPIALADGGDSVRGYQILTPADLAASISGRALFTGEWRAETGDALRAALGARARFTSPLTARRGVWLAELALARAERGAADDPRALEPLYLRRPAITSSKRAETSPAGLAADQRTGGEEAAHAL